MIIKSSNFLYEENVSCNYDIYFDTSDLKCGILISQLNFRFNASNGSIVAGLDAHRERVFNKVLPNIQSFVNDESDFKFGRIITNKIQTNFRDENLLNNLIIRKVYDIQNELNRLDVNGFNLVIGSKYICQGDELTYCGIDNNPTGKLFIFSQKDKEHVRKFCEETLNNLTLKIK